MFMAKVYDPGDCLSHGQGTLSIAQLQGREEGYVGDRSPCTYPNQTYERTTYQLSPGDPIVTWLKGVVPTFVTFATVTYLFWTDKS